MGHLTTLLIGDIAGKPGLNAVRRLLPRMIAEREIDFVVANGENIARGVGITPELAENLFKTGIHCLTTGNHVWRHREIRDYIEREPRLLRPINFPKNQPGNGMGIYETPAGIKVGVVNLAGRVYMDPADNPFVAADKALEKLGEAKVKLFDMHAEATSEKRAMGFYLNGRASVVIGTHTHVQTSDSQILSEGTAYITDVGMTGPHDSVIGMRKELIVERFLSGMPSPFKLAKQGARFQAVLCQIEPTSGHAESIERLDIPVDRA